MTFLVDMMVLILCACQLLAVTGIVRSIFPQQILSLSLRLLSLARLFLWNFLKQAQILIDFLLRIYQPDSIRFK